MAEENNKTKADLVFVNAAIYTMDPARTWAEAIAIAGGRITYVGTTRGAKELASEGTKVVDLKGKMILPGLHDSHVHLIDGGVDMSTCQMVDCKTKAETLAKVKEYVAAHRGGPNDWIRGSGWVLPNFEGGNPSKEDLDRIAKDVPIWLESQDYHSGWANSRALEMCEVTKDTPDPEGGRIERDKHGNPTGTLRESAMHLVSKKIPERQLSDYITGLEKSQKLANSLGITAIQDAWSNDNHIGAYSQFDKEGKLTVKVTSAIEIKEENADASIDQLLDRKKNYQGKNFRVTSAKLFADGVIEACTAALLKPYAGHKCDAGKLLFDPEKMKTIVERLDREGVQVHVHAIGDRAVRTTLDAFEHTFKKNGNIDRRHHIAHLEMIDQEDYQRFRDLFVGANFQSFWCQRDPYIEKLTEPKVGKERSLTLYPMKSIVETGAVLVGGSDWPVSSLAPFDAIEVAIRRRAPGDTTGKMWLPEEAVDLPTMLAAYTINGAYILHQDKETGSLEIGKAADLIVIDQNLFAIPAEKIHNTKVLLTLVNGNEVFRAEGF